MSDTKALMGLASLGESHGLWRRPGDWRAWDEERRAGWVRSHVEAIRDTERGRYFLALHRPLVRHLDPPPAPPVAPKLVDLVRVRRRIEIVPPCPDGFYPCNPSIAVDGDGWRVAVRSVNYWIDVANESYRYHAAGPAVPDTINWLASYTSDWRLRWLHPIDDADWRRGLPACSHGLEDLRLFCWQDGWWALATATAIEDTYHNRMALVRLEGAAVADVRILDSPAGSRREKNWMPCVRNDQLLLVRWAAPLEVYRYRDGRPVRLPYTGENETLAGWRGSSQIVPWGKDTWLCVLHTATRVDRLWVYRHRLTLWSDEWRLLATSEPFALELDGVEFLAGLAVQGDRVALSYGLIDRQAIVLETDRASIDRLLS
jgi:hypothetical protein